MLRWRDAMEQALYGARGFYTAGTGPAAHFRTSVHASPLFAGAVLALLTGLDEALDRPDPLTVVDVGAGRGELLAALGRLAPEPLVPRLRLVAVERAGRPDGLPDRIEWRSEPPAGITGLLLATEWLDNVPLDVVDLAADGVPQAVLVDPETGAEQACGPVAGADAAWLDRWWPDPRPGDRVELGRQRDEAWAAAIATIERGAALAVDYGYRSADRPRRGTLTGYRDGRQVPPVPDGSCDLTAHVAFDPVAAAGATAAGVAPSVVEQRAALRALGVSGTRPAIELAHRDPAGYVRALARASQAAELTDPAGLGGHLWLLQSIGLPAPIRLG